MEPFEEFLDYSQNQEHILHISVKGIAMMRGVPTLVETLAKYSTEETHTSNAAERIEVAKQEAALAQHEVSNGFPLLMSQAVVALWGGLESLVKIFLVKWLMHEPRAFEAAQIQKLRVRLGEYERMDQEERLYYVVEQLEKDMQMPRSHGVTRYEALLNVFGLSGPLDMEVSRDLFEMGQVRNVIVHRRGIIDRKFIAACPWLPFEANDLVKVSQKDYQRYRNAVIRYVTELIIRVGIYYGMDRVDFQGDSNRDG